MGSPTIRGCHTVMDDVRGMIVPGGRTFFAFSLALTVSAFAGTAFAADALFDAIGRGDLDATRSAVANGADLAAKNADGVTPLGLAVNLGKLDIARYLFVAQQQTAARQNAGRGPFADPFDPGTTTVGAYHPVPISPGAIHVTPTGPATPEPASDEVPVKPVPPPSNTAAADPRDDGEGSIFSRLARWLGLGGGETAEPPPAADPTPAASAIRAEDGDNAISRFFRGLFGFSDSAPENAPPAPPGTPKVSVPEVPPAVPMPVAQPSSTPAPVPAREVEAFPQRPPLRLIEGGPLTIGENLRLGTTREIAYGINRQPPAGCIFKMRGTIAFCVEPVLWRDGLEHQVSVTTVMYNGTKAIVRYDEGKATSLYALFPTEAFPVLDGHFQRKFGPPTDEWTIPVKQVGGPPKDNAVQVWQSRGADGTLSTLELRRYDDARGGFTDMKHGALVLHGSDERPIFPILSQFDVMLMKPPAQ